MSDDTVEKWGHIYPREEVSCPACGQLYGHHRTKVCGICEECDPCCKKRGECQKHDNPPRTELRCTQRLVSAKVFIQRNP